MSTIFILMRQVSMRRRRQCGVVTNELFFASEVSNDAHHAGGSRGDSVCPHDPGR
jgi:hypothetical protein